jgi:predicted XRE-type DNA-binding protein
MPRDAVKAPIASLRQQLADEILRLVGDLPTVISAKLLCIDERRMADLRHGRVQRFSVERLIRMLAQIDRRVDLTVVNTGAPNLRWFGILRDRKRNFQRETREVSLPKHQVEQ